MSHGTQSRLSRTVVGAFCVTLMPTLLRAQAPLKFWVSGAVGVEAASGDTTYRGTMHLTRRLGLGVQFTNRLGVEVFGANTEQRLGAGDYACIDRCPGSYDLTSVGGAVVIGIGAADDASSWRLSVGVDKSHLVRDRPYGRAIPDVSVVGVEMGVERRLGAWTHGDVSLQLRVVQLPNANGSNLWSIPLEVRGRLW